MLIYDSGTVSVVIYQLNRGSLLY